MEDCRKYLYSPYPRTPLRVRNYARKKSLFAFSGPDNDQARESPNGKRTSSTCPNSPKRRKIHESLKGSRSAPVSPSRKWAKKVPAFAASIAADTIAQRQNRVKKAKLCKKVEEKKFRRKEERNSRPYGNCDTDGKKMKKGRRRDHWEHVDRKSRKGFQHQRGKTVDSLNESECIRNGSRRKKSRSVGKIKNLRKQKMDIDVRPFLDFANY